MKRVIAILICVCLYSCSTVQISGTTDETELSIKGCVTSDQGQPLGGIQVQLFTANATVPFSKTITDLNGLFRFEKMVPDTYFLWAEDRDSVAASSGAFVLNTEDSSSHNLLMHRTGSLTAFVKLPDGENPSRVLVYIPGTPRIGTPDSLGKIIMDNMAQGNYSLNLQIPSGSYDPLTRSFSITSDQGDTLKDTLIFILRNPKVTTNNLWDLSSGNGLSVAIGENASILSSIDGVTWVSRNSPESPVGNYQNFLDVAWGNNTFVIITDFGGILASPDGISWTDVSTKTALMRANTFPTKIAFANQQFVAFGTYQQRDIDSSTIYASKDGINWTYHDISFTPADIIGTGSEFIAFSEAGVFVSSDLQNWTQTDTMSISNVTRGNNTLFIGLHYQMVKDTNRAVFVISNDGRHWTVISHNTFVNIEHLVWANNRFYAFVWLSRYERELQTSIDGKTWRHEGLIDMSIYGCTNLQWDGKKFIAIGLSGFTSISTDGLHWSSGGAIGDFFPAVVWNGTEFVAVTDGITTFSTFSTNGSSSIKKVNDLQYVCTPSLFCNNGTYLTEYRANAYTSTDAIHWTSTLIDSNYEKLTQYNPDTTSVFQIATGNGKFVAFAGPNHFYVSSDGKEWKRTDVSFGQGTRNYSGLGTIFFGNDHFVAVDNSGLIYISMDGSNWTVKDIGLQTSTGRICGAAGPNSMVISCYGTVAVSNGNGETWIASETPEQSAFPEEKDFKTLLWDGEQFVGTTDLSFWTSSDGHSWRRRGDVPQLPSNVIPGTVPKISTMVFNGKYYAVITGTGSLYIIDKFHD